SMVELETRTLTEELGEPSVVHRRQGVFSLWRGTRVEPEEEDPRLAQAANTFRQLPHRAGTNGERPEGKGEVEPPRPSNDDDPTAAPPSPRAGEETGT